MIVLSHKSYITLQDGCVSTVFYAGHTAYTRAKRNQKHKRSCAGVCVLQSVYVGAVGVCTRVCSTVHQSEGSLVFCMLYERFTIFFACGTGPGQGGPPGSFEVTLGTLLHISYFSLSLCVNISHILCVNERSTMVSR